MSEDRFYMPVRVFCGRGVVEAHGKDLKKLGSKALIVTGAHSAKACGVYDDICRTLDENEVEHVWFHEVEENPSASTVMKARDFGLAQKADFVIGAGGGSPMDAAKAVALMMKHPQEGREYLYTSGADGSTLPVVCIPTTCGTGSEVTAVSVLTDDVKKVKGSIPFKLFPELALIDGSYLRAAGPRTICNTAFDALSHLYESWLNADAGVISRLIAEDGLREWKECLPVLRGERTAEDADYETLMRAAMLGGMAIAHTGTSLPHALSYALTCDLHVPHGKAVCTFMAGYLKEASPEDSSRILELAGFSSVGEFCETFRACCGSLEIPQEELLPVMEKTIRAVASNPSKCAKAPFAVDEALIGRIVDSGKPAKNDSEADDSGSAAQEDIEADHSVHSEKKKYKAVLFDLDGTINDSGPGILNSVRYSLKKLGYEIPAEETLRRFVGPSLVYSYTTFCNMSEEIAWKAVEAYRECYHAGECYNLNLYDGICSLLSDLGKSGIRCAVVTSKPQEMSKQILEHFDMMKYFDVVAGPDPDDPSNKKSVLIGRALKELALPAGDVIMVGDSRFDIIGAKEAGCGSIGVTYGYGTREELVESGADYIVDSVYQIRPVLGLSD